MSVTEVEKGTVAYVSSHESSGACADYSAVASTSPTEPGNEWRPESYAREVLAQRALRYVTPAMTAFLLAHKIKRVRIAGGAMLRGTPRDIDLWPAPAFSKAFRCAAESAPNRNHRNAVPNHNGTAVIPGDYVVDGLPVQLCTVEAPTLRELVERFDFAHCQVGAELAYGEASEQFGVVEVCWTDRFLAAMLVQGTHYVGGGSHTNSLARIPEVAQKLGLNRGETRALTLQVVTRLAKEPQADLNRFFKGDR